MNEIGMHVIPDFMVGFVDGMIFILTFMAGYSYARIFREW